MVFRKPFDLRKGNETGIQLKKKRRLVLWLPPRDSNPDMLIQSPVIPSEYKENKDLLSAKCDQVRQNPQIGRKQNDGGSS